MDDLMLETQLSNDWAAMSNLSTSPLAFLTSVHLCAISPKPYATSPSSSLPPNRRHRCCVCLICDLHFYSILTFPASISSCYVLSVSSSTEFFGILLLDLG